MTAGALGSARGALWPLCRILPVLLLSRLAAAETTPKGYSVSHYFVSIAPDFEARVFRGRETVELASSRPLEEIRLDAHDLQVISLRLDSRAASFRLEGGQLVVATALAPGRPHRLTFDYRVAPTAGVHWEARQVYTAWATSHWMACDDDPADRARLTLDVTVPEGLTAAGSGRLATSATRRGLRTTRWEQTAPVPSFVFGFAAGEFHETIGQAGKVGLRFLGERHDPAQLARIFACTADMVAFFEEKAGVPLPGGRYTQVLLAGNPKQELATLTLLGSAYGDEVLEKPDELWLMAHELAHQWWGIGLACRDWTDFWLNEGLATFMADAYLEYAFGAERYAAEMEAVHARYLNAIAAGRDHPLHFTGWTSVSEVGGSLPYNKGAWVLKLLRERLGEEHFWAGLRRYTRENLGRTVTSLDLQTAMEAASGEGLAAFFDEWVNR